MARFYLYPIKYAQVCKSKSISSIYLCCYMSIIRLFFVVIIATQDDRQFYVVSYLYEHKAVTSPNMMNYHTSSVSFLNVVCFFTVYI